MCRAGHSRWLFTDSESCFVGEDTRLYRCVCPIATCSVTPTGHACRLTSSFLVFCGFLLLVWLLAVGAYVYMSGLIWEHQKTVKPERSYPIGGGYYYEKLFGSDNVEMNETQGARPLERREEGA
ncbi:hypothetical protein DQ04_00641180 [Trypanosoma grayi]|uniref:hypothetical protein n=1 Tax=Trypanosoma grayi TaxID=71804 RepID=UPI0004F4544A|nr:hypothetical protein DQ04_00641180 [Trypanosoma grayi]KEG14074.1 hypothetical protein DQ04_00641180 [Trypanosoma grayi]